MRAEKPRATITHRFTLRTKTRYQRTDEIDEKVYRKSNKKTVTRCFENCARENALYIVRDRRWSSGGRIFFPLGRDQARSVQTHITYFAPNAVSSFLLFCHCLPCLPPPLFASFFLSRSVSFPRSFRYTFVCVRVRVCVRVCSCVSLWLRYLCRVCIHETKRGKIFGAKHIPRECTLVLWLSRHAYASRSRASE